MHVPLRLIIGCMFFFFLYHPALAQEKKVEFKILSNRNEVLSYASVTVLEVPDSLNRQEKIADSLGQVYFQLMQGHFYRVRVSHSGYAEVEKNITIKGDHPQYTIEMSTRTGAMSGIIVKSTRPLIRQEDDKTIVDAESLAAISTNAYEILEKTPGLFVDQDGNIYLSSTTPATVYINGREQKMSAADIATMLKSLPPNAIASIEILRTPSARYDASGSGGVVNVVLKKGVKVGLTGSITTGLNQGKYGNRFIGLNLNNSKGALTTYLNVQYGKRNSFDHIQTDRFFPADASLLSQNALTRYAADNAYVGIGIGYQLNTKWTLNYDARWSENWSNNNSNNVSVISKNAQVQANYRATVINNAVNYNINQGINAKYKLDSAGSEWTTDVSFNYAPNVNHQQFNTGNGKINSRLNFFTAQSNLVKKLKNSITVETGLKTSLVHFNNKTNYFRGSPSSTVSDSTRSGAYRYVENINALFIQASRKFSGIIVKMGTRLENTNMEGTQLSPADTSFSIHRTDLFPYIYLSRNIMKIAGYDLRAYLVFRRTISRPAYEYLNPSLRIIDPFLFETGNPTLRPQFTRNYEANISVDERPLVAFGINETKDIFTQVIYQSDTNQLVSKRTYDNLGSNKEHYIRLLGAIPPGRKYFFVLGAQYNHNFYRGLYENKPLSYKKGSWTIFTYHQLKLTPLTQLSVNGYARFNGQQQFYELSTFGELRMSINQQFFKKKLNITLSLNDIFKTNQNEFSINQGSVMATGMREGDTRRFGLNIRYNFGLRKKEENNVFNTESPEKAN